MVSKGGAMGEEISIDEAIMLTAAQRQALIAGEAEFNLLLQKENMRHSNAINDIEILRRRKRDALVNKFMRDNRKNLAGS